MMSEVKTSDRDRQNDTNNLPPEIQRFFDEIYYSALEETVTDNLKDVKYAVEFAKNRDGFVEWGDDKLATESTSILNKIYRKSKNVKNFRIVHPTEKTRHIMNMLNFINVPAFNETNAKISNGWSTNAIKLSLKMNELSLKLFIENEIIQLLRTDKTVKINNEAVRMFTIDELKNVFAYGRKMTEQEIQEHVSTIYNKYVQEFTYFLSDNIRSVVGDRSNTMSIEREIKKSVLLQLVFGFIPFCKKDVDIVNYERNDTEISASGVSLNSQNKFMTYENTKTNTLFSYVTHAKQLCDPRSEILDFSNAMILYDIKLRKIYVYDVVKGSSCDTFSLNFGQAQPYLSRTNELMLGSIGENLLTQELIYYNIRNLYYGAQFPRYYVVTESRPDQQKRKRDDCDDEIEEEYETQLKRGREASLKLDGLELKEQLKRISDYDKQMDKIRREEASAKIKRQYERVQQSKNIGKFSDQATQKLYSLLQDLSTRKNNFANTGCEQYNTFLRKKTAAENKLQSLSAQLRELEQNLQMYEISTDGNPTATDIGKTVAYATVESCLKEYEPEIQKIASYSEQLYDKIFEYNDKLSSQMPAEMYKCLEEDQYEIDKQMANEEDLLKIQSYASRDQDLNPIRSEIPTCAVSDKMSAIEALKYKTQRLQYVNQQLFRHVYSQKHEISRVTKKGIDSLSKQKLAEVENKDIKQLLQKLKMLTNTTIRSLDKQVNELKVELKDYKAKLEEMKAKKIEPKIQALDESLKSITNTALEIDSWKTKIQTEILKQANCANGVTVYDQLIGQLSAEKKQMSTNAESLQARIDDERKQLSDKYLNGKNNKELNKLVTNIKKTYKDKIKRNMEEELRKKLKDNDDHTFESLKINGRQRSTQSPIVTDFSNNTFTPQYFNLDKIFRKSDFTEKVSEESYNVFKQMVDDVWNSINELLFPQLKTVNINGVTQTSLDYVAVEQNILIPFMKNVYGIDVSDKYGMGEKYLCDKKEILNNILTNKCVPLMISNVVKLSVSEKQKEHRNGPTGTRERLIERRYDSTFESL